MEELPDPGGAHGATCATMDACPLYVLWPLAFGTHSSVLQMRPAIDVPPWRHCTFRVDLPVATRRSDAPAVRREAALRAIAELPHPGVTIWPDGSAHGRGTEQGGAGALIQLHHLNREETMRTHAGAICSSLRAELTAMREALAVAAGLEGEYLALTKSVHLLTYSRSGLQLLSRGQANQAMALAAEVWSMLNTLADSGIETVCSGGAGPCWPGRQRDRRPPGWRGFCGRPGQRTDRPDECAGRRDSLTTPSRAGGQSPSPS